jgi:hypothetical protein
MSDIITKLERIRQTKTEIREAINIKGAACETDCFREYPERILQIPSGGSGPGSARLQEKLVTENGIYTPSPGYDGFSKVTVRVSGDNTMPHQIMYLGPHNFVRENPTDTLKDPQVVYAKHYQEIAIVEIQKA